MSTAFDKLGYEKCSGLFDLDDLEEVENVISSLYEMQANKIIDYQHRPFPILLDVMEEKDKVALYEVQKFIGSSIQVRELFYDIHATAAKRLGCDERSVLIEGPGLFVSRPNTSRLLYKWHSEAHYYPKRRRFLNFWAPIFTDRTKDNGAMHIKPGTHKQQWDFAEYDSGPHTFVQYEIPEQWVANVPSHVCESKRGEFYLFDRNLVHRSAENKTSAYAFALVARLWSPIADLTLSGTMSATPYGGDIGRAGIIVPR